MRKIFFQFAGQALCTFSSEKVYDMHLICALRDCLLLPKKFFEELHFPSFEIFFYFSFCCAVFWGKKLVL